MEYNKLIDHTVLKAETKEEAVRKLVAEAIEFNFASVCVNPCFVKLCAKLLKKSEVKVCTVVGFPLGATTTDVKVFETKEAIENGAHEIDMVLNVGALKDGDERYVLNEMKRIKNAANGNLVKVIIEACLLTDEEKVTACKLAKKAGLDFVKTSTGFSTGGATVADIKLMRKTVGPEIGVKASGGVKTYQDMVDLVNAGATRIGTSSGPKLVKKEDSTTNY